MTPTTMDAKAVAALKQARTAARTAVQERIALDTGVKQAQGKLALGRPCGSGDVAAAAKLLQPVQWHAVVGERAASSACGYPLCGRGLPIRRVTRCVLLYRIGWLLVVLHMSRALASGRNHCVMLPPCTDGRKQEQKHLARQLRI